jgi:hypothetical protein
MKRKELEIRQKERAERKMTKNVSMKRSLNENFRLTQDELLEEAIETEKINLASLGIRRFLKTTTVFLIKSFYRCLSQA